MTTDNTTTIWALDVLGRYAPAPIEQPRMDKRRLLNSLQKLDHEMRTSKYPVVFEDEQRDAAEFFAAEQCPSDATFR